MPRYEIEIDHRESDQVFSYHHGDTVLHFNASLLARLRPQMRDQFRRLTMDIGPGEYDLVMKHRGIDERKVEALKPSDLREPGYGVFFEDGSFTVVDGHHRLVRRYRGNLTTMDFWITHEAVWEHCLVPYSAEDSAALAEHLPPKSDNPSQLATRVTLHKDGDNQ